MDDGNQKNGKYIKKEREEVFSKVVRAGKRTYFFDVKVSRTKDLFITITESMKRSTLDGRFFYEKHKIFLYREDFESFVDGLSSLLEYVEARPENKKVIKSPRIDAMIEEAEAIDTFTEFESAITGTYSNIEFEDLGKQH